MPAYNFLIPAHAWSIIILLSVHAVFAVILLGYVILFSFIPKHNNSIVQCGFLTMTQKLRLI